MNQVFDGGVGGAENIDTVLPAFLNPSSNVGHRFATPITLNATTTIGSIEWTGAYNWEVNNQTLPEINDRFVIEIFERASDGAPNSDTMVRFEVGDGNAVDSGVTKGDDSAYRIYDYSAEVDFTMEADKTYWVSIYTLINEQQSNVGDVWSWGMKRDLALNETVERATWGGDKFTDYDDNWRQEIRDQVVPFFRYAADMDIRLRTFQLADQ